MVHNEVEKREKYGMVAAIAVAALIVASILIYPLLSQAPTLTILESNWDWLKGGGVGAWLRSGYIRDAI